MLKNVCAWVDGSFARSAEGLKDGQKEKRRAVACESNCGTQWLSLRVGQDTRVPWGLDEEKGVRASKVS